MLRTTVQRRALRSASLAAASSSSSSSAASTSTSSSASSSTLGLGSVLIRRRCDVGKIHSAGVRGFKTSPAVEALQKFAMPAMSPTMTEGGIASWKKKEGESYAPGDVLLEIETDKATMDVEAQEEGVLAKILVGDGSKNVPVGKAIAITAEEAEDVESSEVDKLASEAEKEAPSKDEQPKEEESKPKEEEQPKKESPAPSKEEKKPEPKKEESKKSEDEPSGPKEYVYASPIAKKLAQERGIPLNKVKGTGPNGRIIKEDIEKYKGESGGAVASGAGTSKTLGSPPPSDVSVPVYTDSPVSNMRRTIASRLTESKQSIPHYYLTSEINVDRLSKLREVFNKASQSASADSKDGVKAGTKLSVNDFVVKAAALALQDVPEANSAWFGDFVRQYHKADISIAVATPNGLITPIIKDVGSKGLSSISSTAKSLASKARDGKLSPAEYQGGTFTISNLGMFGIEHFTAIINPPQSCILAVGRSERKLVRDDAEEKGFREVEVMKVTLSCDHRIVDGAVGARWMKAFKEYLENPLSFML